MKKKFIIILTILAVVGIASNAFADKSTPFTAVTLDTNNDGFVDAIDLYITFNILDGSTTWANLTDDFEVGGYASPVIIDGVDTGAVPNDNICRVHIHSSVPNTIPTSIETLTIRYTYDGTNQIVTDDPPSGDYLWSFNWMAVEDGAAPSLLSTTFVSDHQNTSLAIEGSIITVDFESNEELLDFPTVKIYAVGGPEGAEINATMVVDRYHWTVSKVMTSLDNVSGFIEAKFTIEDVNYNEDTKTVTSTIAYKTDPATEVYVDPTYTAQANVPAGKFWLWDCFEKIQDGIDGVTDPGTVIVLEGTTGIYNEDLVIDKTIELRPYGTAKAYDVVTLKGVATLPFGDWPLAAPNIDIQATGVSIHDFKIEAPDYVVGFYSSGIVVGATNAAIYLNDFYATSASNTDDICQSIQTYNGVDVSGLNIYTNTFTNKTTGIVGDWGYEGIYINPGGTGLVNIEDNTIGGKLFRGITAQRSNCNIEANNISTDLDPVSDDWVTAGAWVGIWAYDNISDVVITGNTVQGDVGGAGFNRGIRLGHTGGSTFTNLSVTSNEIYYNKNGIYSQSAAGITITGNAIENNTAYGIYCDTGTLNAENNWWNSANGPTHADNTFNVTAQGDVSSDHVDYVPWYDTNMTGTSFAPIEKDDGLKAITYFSSFQTAINAASPGDVISAATGYFDEQFTVDVQNLTIQSKSGESATIQPTAAPVPAFYDVQVFASYTTLQELVFDFGDRESVFTGIVVGEYGEPLCPATVSNVNILYNDFYSDGVAIQTGYTIDINDLLISVNFFYLDGNAGTADGAAGIYVSPFPGPPIKGGVTISNNWFEGYVDYGVAIDASNVTVTDNYIFGAGSTVRRAFIRYIDWYGNDNNNVVITYNEMGDISRGIWVQSHEGTGTLSGIIQYNYFTDCVEGILLATGLTTSLEITENDFVTTVIKGVNTAVNNTTTVLADCENNWWDSVNGPTHSGNTFNVTAQGENVTDYVDYVPWLDDEFDVGIPFAPVFKVSLIKNGFEDFSSAAVELFHVPFKNGTVEYFSSIQAAIDAAIYGDGIGCYAGTFTEDFVVDVSVLIEGEPGTKQLVTIVGEQEITSGTVWFENFIFDPDGAGTAILVNSSAAPINDITIIGCTFDLTTSPSVGIYLGGGGTPNLVSQVSMFSNVFNGPDDKNCNPWKVGGWFGTNISCAIDGIMFSDNEVNKGSIPINLVDADINDIWIYENDFLDTDGVIYFWNSPASSPTGVLDYFLFENNYVPSSNSYGIAIGGASLGGPTFTDANFGPHIAINDNAFEMSGTTYGYGAVYMADQYTGLLDASENWWGDANGPENDNNTYTPPSAPKGRATVSDRVEFAPWWNDGTDKYPTERGWYPDTGTTLFAPVINVTDDPDTYHSSIQRGVDAASGGDVLTCIAGTFTEDVVIDKTLEIRPNGTAKAYDDVTIKGVRTEPVANWPLATENIDIAANGVEIHHFTIESPTIADGYYSSGIVLNGIDIEIYDNDFVIDGTLTHDSRAVCIQTRRIDVFPTACVDGLLIQDNTFGGVIGTRGYYGIYINRDDNSGTVTITENELTGRMRAGIANERSNVVISNNSFDGGGATWTGENINGMWIIDWDITRTIDNVDITGNTISNFASDGIELGWEAAGPTYQTLTDVVVSYNTITGNDKGIKVASGADGISVNYNNISGNTTYGAENTHTTLLDATKNWWGDATGPDDDGDTNPHTTPLGDKVSSDIIFFPWYATSTVTPTTEYVRTHMSAPKIATDLAFADFIQACIDAAADVYYYVQVTDAATPYTENLTVDNQAYIYGSGNKASPPVTIIGTHVITGNDVTFDEFTLTPGAGISGTVITINSASQIINNTTIENCQFDIQTSPSIGVYVGGGTPTNAVTNAYITDCTFNGPADKISNPFKIGGQFGSPVGCEIVDMYFEDNYVNYGSIPVNLADKDIDGLNVVDNDFANTDGVIYFWAEAGAKSPAGEITAFYFANNYVGATNSYGVGFDVFGNFTAANYGSYINIDYNYFDENIPGAYGFDAVSILTPTADLAGYVLDATDNWWGSEDGPDHVSNTFNIYTQGVAVSDNVDFVQWYDSGDGYNDPGWIPTGSLFAPVEIAPTKAYPYYASIQAAIDAASSDFTITCYAGTFYEDFSVPASKTYLDMTPYWTAKGFDDVTIKGQATVESSLWPLADPNIEILGEGFAICDFTIEAPDYVVGYYSSGIVVGAIDAYICDNTFVNNVVDNTDDISQTIQTYKNIDCTDLYIKDNTFTDNSAKSTYDWGYEAIYINPGCGSELYIGWNDFEGMCFRAITIEDAGTESEIEDNCIKTSMAPVPSDWSTPGAYQGINLQGNLSDIEIWNNYIGGVDASSGFAQGIRLGSDGDTFTDIDIDYNEIRYNSYGVLCKSASGVSFNHRNIIDGNAFGVQNDDTTTKTVLDARNNYWGATDGPSFTFDYGMGSGSGDEVSEYVDFYPWYEDDGFTTLYDLIMDQFLLEINPTSPYVDNYFDLRVCAADAAGIRDFSYGNLADFSSSHAALTVPEEQLLVDGFKEIVGGCISAQPFEASDHLTLYAWEYMTNPPDYLSELTDIVIQELNNPAPPTGVVYTDNPGDNGGWIIVDYTLSTDDPFYTVPPKDNYGVSYYVVEIDTAIASGVPDWHFLADIACYDNGLPGNDYTALLPAPASDTKYNFRMASVYNPTKLGGFDENHISYEEIVTKDGGAQSAWQTGSAAPKDNLPAYAHMNMFLEGPYQVGGTMINGLTLPTVSPYDLIDIGTLPSVSGRTLIDWIYVELRKTKTGATVKEANAFVLDNGMIVDTEGNYSLPFYYTTNVEYYLVIQHRNHLAIMSAVTHTFGDFASQATSIDLTTVGTAYLNGFKEVDTGVYAMYDGDANGSELVNVNDAFDLIDHFGMAGYLGSDLNLSGYVNVNDAYELIGNFGIGSSVPSTTKGDLGNEQNVDFNVPITTGAKVLECTLEIKNVQLVAGVSYSFDVYITRNTSNWSALGHLTFLTETYYSELVFNYNGSALNNPVVSNLSPVATGTNVTTPSSGVLAIEVIDGGSNVPATETKLFTVTFDITDPSATAQLSWRTGDTSIINESSNNYNTAEGTLSLLGSDNSTLPVELSSFKAIFSAANENVELRWDTASETGVNGFNIYRSDVKDITRAGRHINYSLITAAGTTSKPQSYNYSDVVADVYVAHYYWLEVVDLGGTSSFHGPYTYTPGDIDGDSTPDLIASTQLLGNFPNPVISSTQIRYQLKGTVIDQNATISVYNVRGELVKTLEGKNGVATLDTSNMGHGIYFYRLQADDYSEIKKLVVVK